MYRLNALFIVRNYCNRHLELLKKQLYKLFNRSGLYITIERWNCSIKYLDASCNLNTRLHEQYMKQNSNLRYINTSSNHPQQTKEDLLGNISKRISQLSSNETILERKECERMTWKSDTIIKSAIKPWGLNCKSRILYLEWGHSIFFNHNLKVD